ncbi:MAG: hypothetical protein RLZ87_49, partial [Armatimonadota bacterium]
TETVIASKISGYDLEIADCYFGAVELVTLEVGSIVENGV